MDDQPIIQQQSLMKKTIRKPNMVRPTRYQPMNRMGSGGNMMGGSQQSMNNFNRNEQSNPSINPNVFFKTKLCPHYQNGGCKKGSTCTFAHSEAELRDTPNLKKTKMCQLFMMGKCHIGQNCSFAHGEEELKDCATFYKTAMCHFWTNGQRCQNGPNCRFAHGEDELKQP